MANTGQKVVLTLKQIDQTTGDPTGLTKNNSSSDPDYIAPYIDLTDCPITTSLTCPAVIIATGYTNGTAQFEFSLPPNTTNYPGLGRVKIRVMDSTPAEVTNVIFVIPNTPTNYFVGSVSGLTAATTYTLRIQYLDSSNTLLSGGDCITTSGTFTTNATP
jgi:hypothetical protein